VVVVVVVVVVMVVSSFTYESIDEVLHHL